MTPTRKMIGKMTGKTKNSPLKTSVAKKLSLENLPSVKLIVEGLQRSHPPLAQNGANFIQRKQVINSSSVVAMKTVCTPVYQANQPMGRERGQQMEAWVADQPIRAKKREKTCQTTQGIIER